jgi:hypothetical protein
MNALDPNTLERIAEIICDSDGDHHRQYWQLENFFANAGWALPPYDERGRLRWTREMLLSHQNDPAAITAVICRLADPREYRDRPDDAVEVAEQLNGLLAFEGLRITYIGGRPELVESEPAFRTPATTAPLSLQADLAHIVRDQRLAALLRKRLDEARTCREYGAHLSSVIMLGSVLEGTLHDIVRQHPAEAYRCPSAPKGQNGKPKDSAAWKLAELIDVAHACGWIELDARRFSHELRDYRNMVHPSRELIDAHHPDEDTVAICWNVVVAALNDLARLAGLSTSADPR